MGESVKENPPADNSEDGDETYCNRSKREWGKRAESLCPMIIIFNLFLVRAMLRGLFLNFVPMTARSGFT